MISSWFPRRSAFSAPCCQRLEAHWSFRGKKMQRKAERPHTPSRQSRCTEGCLLSTVASILTQHMPLMTEMCPTCLPSPSSLSPCSAHRLPRVRDCGKHGQARLPPAGHTGHCRQTVCRERVPGVLDQSRGKQLLGPLRRTLSSGWKTAESPVSLVSLWASLGNSSRVWVAFWAP